MTNGQLMPSSTPMAPPDAPFDAPPDALPDALPDAAADTPRESIGAALRLARERAGLSVEQVSTSTCIRAALVRDLEADRFGTSGGSVYARGHLRALAVAAGLDPVGLVARFDAEQGQPDASPFAGTTPTRSGGGAGDVATAVGGGRRSRATSGRVGPGIALPTPPVRERSGGRGIVLPTPPVRERSGPRWGAALVTAATVLAIVTAIGLHNPPARPVPAAALPAAAGTGRLPAAGAVVKVQAPAAAKPVLSGAKLHVRLVGGASWVSVRNASATLFEGVLSPGQSKDFTDPQGLRVTIGNAGAVDLRCSGRGSGQAGGPGMVLRFSCTKDGLAPA